MFKTCQNVSKDLLIQKEWSKHSSYPCCARTHGEAIIILLIMCKLTTEGVTQSESLPTVWSGPLCRKGFRCYLGNLCTYTILNHSIIDSLQKLFPCWWRHPHLSSTHIYAAWPRNVRSLKLSHVQWRGSWRNSRHSLNAIYFFQVLSCFRALHRAREVVFAGDEFALAGEHLMDDVEWCTELWEKVLWLWGYYPVCQTKKSVNPTFPSHVALDAAKMQNLQISARVLEFTLCTTVGIML